MRRARASGLSLSVSIPYLRVTHQGYTPFEKYVRGVSIPYLRVTHAGSALASAIREGFQSPIYGSRTDSAPFPLFRPGQVSIPYLRVTHREKGFQKKKEEGFNPLSTGHARRLEFPTNVWVHMFQSPIYGSRTWKKNLGCGKVMRFNPLSTGHAPQYGQLLMDIHEGFNPLSTGHAPIPDGLILILR